MVRTLGEPVCSVQYKSPCSLGFIGTQSFSAFGSAAIQNLKRNSVCFHSNSELRIRSLNAQSLCNKLAELQVLLLSGEIDILCIVETWLTDAYPDSLLSATGAYQVVRADRGSRGGGVVFLLRKGISFVSVQVADRLEIVALDLVSSQGKYRLLGVYLPPRLEFIVLSLALAEILRLIDVSYPVLVLGDFNFPEIEWSMKIKPRGLAPQTFLEFTITAGLEQMVTESTRQDSILDLVLASDIDTVLKVNVVEPFGNSDHNAVDLAISWDPPCEQIESYIDFRSANWTEMRAFLGSFDWAHILGCCATVDNCWDAIYWRLQQAIEAFVPKKVYRSALDPLPLYLRKLRSKRRRLFRRRKTSAMAAARAVSFGAIYRRKLKNFCRKREEKILAGNSLNALYRFIKKKTKVRSVIPALESESDSASVQTDFTKAEIFNKFFGSVFTRDVGGTVPFGDRDFGSELATVTVNEITVQKVLAKMPGKLSCGPDGIPALLYKQCSRVLAFPLALLFKRSLESGDIPEIWKHTLVVPIFKKGNKSKPTNYRPVSLSCVVMLIFERCVKLFILGHLETNKLLSDKQYGFRKRRSVDIQLLTTLNQWTTALDKGYCIDAVYTDFAKAFDTVSHSKLLLKLKAFGIRGKLLAWITNYFKGRKQSVKIGSQYSSWLEVTSGVPQGSVLGPLFFIIFIDDLVRELPPGVTIMLYADDAKLYFVYPAYMWSPLLQMALTVLETWSLSWGLQLAVPKCQVLYLGRTNPRRMYNLFGEELKVASSVRDLGVTISEDLSWYAHITGIVSKASNCANAILKSFHYVDFKLLAKAFIIYIRPILESACAVWGPHLKQDKQLVESVQRKFTKKLFLKCGIQSASYEDRLRVLGWDSLEYRRGCADLVLMFHILKGHTEGADDLVRLHAPHMGLRGNRTRITCDRPRLDVRKYFFCTRIVDKWNALDIDISVFKTAKQFAAYLYECTGC